MGGFLGLAASVFLLLALPAAARGMTRLDQDRFGLALYEFARFVVAVAAAAVLILLAWGRLA